MHFNPNVHFFKQQKRLHALGENENPSIRAILAFKGKCAVEKEGMIGEIKLKCRKKNISNRREFLPVVLAKMLSWCSVRLHRCTGSPADYPNTMLSCQVPGKLSCNCSLRELSSSDLGGSVVPYFPRLAGQPLGHSCSISWFSCQMVCGTFKGTAREEGMPSSTHWHGRGCSGESFPGTLWQRTWEAVCSCSPSCLLRPTELPKHCQPALKQFPEPYYCALQFHFQIFH